MKMLTEIIEDIGLDGMYDDFRNDCITLVIMECLLVSFAVCAAIAVFFLFFILPYFINIWLGLAVNLIFVCPLMMMVYVRYIEK